MKDKLEAFGCLLWCLLLLFIFIVVFTYPVGNKSKERHASPASTSYKNTSSSVGCGSGVEDSLGLDKNSVGNQQWQPSTPREIGYHDGYVVGQRDASNGACRYSSYCIQSNEQYSEEEMKEYESGYSSGYADGYSALHDEKERRREEERKRYERMHPMSRRY